MNAEEVMVVAAVAQLVVEVAVLQQHPAQHFGLDQYLQRAVDGGPAQRGGQLLAQTLGGKVPVLLSNGRGQGPPGAVERYPRSSSASRMRSVAETLRFFNVIMNQPSSFNETMYLSPGFYNAITAKSTACNRGEYCKTLSPLRERVWVRVKSLEGKAVHCWLLPLGSCEGWDDGSFAIT